MQFPILVSFSILRASMSSDIQMHDGLPCAINSLNLVLLANRDTRIQLSEGEPLSEIEINFSLSSKWHTPGELDRDLTSNDVGFLCHTRESNGKAFVHGAAVWPNDPLLQYLLAENQSRNVQFTIAPLPTLLESSKPLLWGTNRENILRLSSVRFSLLQGEG